jgi:hypothetical protein
VHGFELPHRGADIALIGALLVSFAAGVWLASGRSARSRRPSGRPPAAGTSLQRIGGSPDALRRAAAQRARRSASAALAAGPTQAARARAIELPAVQVAGPSVVAPDGERRAPPDSFADALAAQAAAAGALAARMADSDPQRIAEVIRQWINADMTGEDFDRRRP